jgi:citrate synthase
MAETILDVLRGDEGFTHDEAMMLDVMLMLHAEHGGGNNSTFTCACSRSSGTDAYSTYAAAMGLAQGPQARRGQRQGGQ